MRKTLVGAGLSCASAVALSSCSDWEPQDRAMPTELDGAAFFAANCAACHGQDGRGAGLRSSDLAARPVDLTRLSDGHGGAFPAARALSYIYGDPETSHLARVMPEFGSAMANDTVPVEIDGVLTPTPRELAGLLVFLERIQRTPD